MNTCSRHTLARLTLMLGAFVAAPSGVVCAQTTVPEAVSAPAVEFARSNNALAFDLYAKTRSQPGNFALAPISISTALAMTSVGARGDTAAEIQSVLHADKNDAATPGTVALLLADLHQEEGGATLRIANRLFGAKSFAFDARYLDQTKTFFGAALEPLDFAESEPSRLHINDWVAKQTAGRIHEVIPSGALNPQTRLVLVNAVYFLGQWTSPFTAESTVPVPFHATTSEAHAVPTMHQMERLPFAHTDGVKLLELPYRGGEVSMLLVLPDVVDGLEAVEQRLSPAVFDHWLSAISTRPVFVALPKFEISPAQSLALSNTLSVLGMPLAFDSDHADFSGIADPNSASDRLYIGEVFHQAFVKLDELGTEAAAATAVVAFETSAALPSGPSPEVFRADHPFLFVLRHVPTGAILFIGRVSDPAPSPPVASAQADIGWLSRLTRMMASSQFRNEQGSALLKRHRALFASLDIDNDEPSMTSCDQLMRIEVALVPSARPTLTALQNMFGPATEVPRAPDHFYGGTTYVLYPTGPLSDKPDKIGLRVFVDTTQVGSDVIATINISREKNC